MRAAMAGFMVLVLLPLGTAQRKGDLRDPAGGEVSLHFLGTDLKEVLKTFEQYTGKRFLFEEAAVAGRRVNLLSSAPIPADHLMDVLESILEVEGLTLVEVGEAPARIFKVVPTADAAGKAHQTFTRESMEKIPPGDRVVTLVYQLKYLPAEKVKAAFQRMTTVPDGIQAIEGTNLLLITDYASNVKRLGDILSRLDVIGPRIVRETIKLKNTEPAELVREIQPLINIENRVYLAQLQKRVEERLRQVMGRGRGGKNVRGMSGAITDVTTPIGLVPVPRLGSVIVSATEEKLPEIRKLIESLDIKDPEEKVLRFYPLRYQDPVSLAETLQGIFDFTRLSAGRRGKGRPPRGSRSFFSIAIVPDSLSNQVVVVASKKMQAEVEGVIRKLDTFSGTGRVLRFYPLRYADLDDAAALLARLFGLEAGGGAPGRARSRRRGGPKGPGWAARDLVVVDRDLRALLVSAQEGVQAKVADLLEKLDAEGPGKKKVRFYELKYARAVDVARALADLFPAARLRGRGRAGKGGRGMGEDSIAVVADEKKNSLAVLATDRVQAEVDSVIRNLDSETSGMLVKYYPVRRGKVEEIARALGGLFQVEVGETLSPARARRPRPGRGGRPLPETPVIVPDPDLEALVVRAPKRLQEEIARAVERLDVEGPGRRVTKYYRIENTSVTEVANTLQSIFSDGVGLRGGSAGRRRHGPPPPGSRVIIVPNEELSMVVVSAPGEIHDRIAPVIASLDVPSVKDNIVRYYPVRNVGLEEAADTVSKIFGLVKGDDRRLKYLAGRPPRRGSVPQRSPYTDQKIVIADHNISSLLVVAPRQMQEEVGRVLEKIDAPGTGGWEVKYYRVARSSVREVAATVASVFDMDLATSQRRTRVRNPDRPRAPVVIPNETLGLVIVVAPGDVQARVSRLVDSLDTGGPDENELQYYKIRKIDLVEAANIISQIYGINMGSVDQPYRRRGKRPPSELLTKERVVIPNRDLGTILVVAPRKLQKEIADTVRRIDVTGTKENVFRMYDVTAAEVTTSAQTISRLFDIPIMSQGSLRGAGRRGPATGAKLTTQPFLIPDEQLGSLIVNAPEEIHREIKDVLAKLTTIGQLEKMTIRFYKLKNTDAGEVAAKIGNLFNITVGTPDQLANRPARRITRGGVGVRRGRAALPGEESEEEKKKKEAPGETASRPAVPEAPKKPGREEFYFEGESVVIPDKNLNSIILIAPDYIHKEVEKVLKTIDVRRPQVLFEVAILDVSSGGTLNLGTEFTTIDRQGASRLRGHGFTNFGVSSRKGSAQGGFPDQTTVPGNLPGLFLGVSKNKVGNIPFLIRLLQENNDVNIRSTPLLLVNDNQQAVFSSLEEQPTTTTSQGTATTKISFGGFVEAGTILTITPHVSEGNYIRVDIDLKVENFHGEAPGPGIPPPRSSNQLTTSITVPDNSTVVIGGLATTKKTKVTRGVPILKDIPLLGLLFSSLSDEETTSRLYLFLRPQILNDVDFKDLRRISDEKNLEAHGLTGRTMLPGGGSSGEGAAGPASRPSRGEGGKERRP